MRTAAPTATAVVLLPPVPGRGADRALWSALASLSATRATGGGALPPFRERGEHELADLSDEELLAYLLDARRAGRTEGAVTAARILAWKHERALAAFVASKAGDLPQGARDEIVEATLLGAIKYAEKFEGDTLAQFRAILFTIARRRVNDYFRKHYKDGVRIREDSLDGPPDEDGSPRWEVGVGDPADERIEGLHREAVFKQAFSELKKRSHQMVILLVKFKDLPHRKVAEQVNRHLGDELTDPMTEQNVNKINSRFDERLDELLVEAEDPPPEGDHDDS